MFCNKYKKRVKFLSELIDEALSYIDQLQYRVNELEDIIDRMKDERNIPRDNIVKLKLVEGGIE